MKKGLLIVGAGIYGAVVREIAESLSWYDRIGYVDDCSSLSYDGFSVVGKTENIPQLSGEYDEAVVAVGNPTFRAEIISRVKASGLELATLISPRAYFSPSASIGKGSIVEPMAVVHTGVKTGEGCIISAGAVINHFAVLGDFVHVDCNATVKGNVEAPNGIKILSGSFYEG